MESPGITPEGQTYRTIPINQLKPNRWNRTVFDPTGLEELAANIKVEGIKERLIVRTLPDGTYEISSGHRRWLAAQKAGLMDVPCEIRSLTDEEIAQDNISLNLQREDLPPLETARMVKDFMDEFHKTQEEAASRFGKDRTWATKLLGFLKIDPEVLGYVSVLTLGWGSLESLKASPPKVQKQVAQELNGGALKPQDVPKRCNQLRFGQKKGQPKANSQKRTAENSSLSTISSSPPAPDPMADVWSKARKDPYVLRCGDWGAAYGARGQLTVPPSPISPAANGWLFWIEEESQTPKKMLAQWFGLMAERLGYDPTQKESITPAPTE
jgi:ParB family chromosome partitioning protein